MSGFSPATRRLFDDGLSQLLDRIDAATGDVDRRKWLYRAATERLIEVANARIPQNDYLSDLMGKLCDSEAGHPDPRAAEQDR